jgi:hypothetical protein
VRDPARHDRYIRFSGLTGVAMLALGVAWVALLASGLVSASPLSGLQAATFVGLGIIQLRSAHLARLDQDDPTGSERRQLREDVNVSALLVALSWLLVAGVILWGLLGLLG